MSMEDAFWKRVEKKSSGCWEWASYRDRKGYGSIKFVKGGKNVFAHRLSWQIHFGEIPEGLHVCHHCDNPPCVNPDHLFVGTAAENLADMRAKGRGSKPPRGHIDHQRGESNKMAKLTAAQVREIRAIGGRVPQSDLARRYGVGQQAIQKILLRQRWKHIA